MTDESLPVENTLDDPYANLRQAEPWLYAIEQAEKAFAEYYAKCDNIDKLYASLSKLANGTRERQMQIFWANLEVLKPSVYARKPIPVIAPRFKKRDKLYRTTADIGERAVQSSYDLEDLNSTLKLVRDDLVSASRGVVWLRYDMDEDTQTQAVRYEHVERKDFLHDPARKWSEVGWVAKRSWLSKEQGDNRFGEDVWRRVRMEARKDQAVEGSKGEDRGEVWEIWHKSKGVVIWVAPKQDKDGEVLDIQEPPFKLHRFFPCPKPAYGTCERGTLRPVPDFLYYKDQIEEINELTARISALAEALKMKGFYAAGSGDIADAIETALKQADNNAIMVPVPNMAAMGAASLKDSIVWLPVMEVASTIKELVALRQQLISDVYQITGISDIMRGETDASETATAQQIKSQYGSVRVRDKQEAMVGLALEITEMAFEIMAEEFAPDSILKLSQVDDVPSQADIEQQIAAITQQVQAAQADPNLMAMAEANPEQAQQLLQQAQQQIEALQNEVTIEACLSLLRDQKTRPFVLDIETNSTVQPDEQADKQARTEALTAIGGFVAQAGPIVQAQPETGPFIAETLKWLASGFRMGRQMDATIDEFAQKIAEFAKKPKPPAPEQITAEANAKKAEAEVQIKGEELELKKAELGLKQEEIGIRKDEAEFNKENVKTERAFKATQAMQGDSKDEKAAEREAAMAEEEGSRLDGIEQQIAEMVKAITEMRNALAPATIQ